MGVVRDRRILQLILCFTVGRTLTAVGSCPALAAHTGVRRDARPSILAGCGASGCREEEHTQDCTQLRGVGRVSIVYN